jgi:replication factor C large subunit
MTWIEKYRPTSLIEIIGNRSAKAQLLSWAESWQHTNPQKKAVILYGKPGIGKTTSAYAIAHKYQWKPIELNASDERNKDIIKKIALTGAINETLSIQGQFISFKDGARRLIILDEADNLYEREGDYGGKKAIIDTIKATHQPIILIANDYYSLTKGSGTELKHLCEKISFQKVNDREIAGLLKKICRLENIGGDLKVIDTIAAMADGDVRGAINDLQAIAYEKRLDKKMLSQIGYRNREREIFSGIRDILKTKDMKTAIFEMRRLNEAPDSFILWIDENLPIEYKNHNDLAKAYEFLSRADIFLGRVWHRQYYGLWSYATDLMTGGVAVAKKYDYKGFRRYSFPQWLRRMSTSKQRRQLTLQLAYKIGTYLHCSTKKAIKYVPTLTTLFKNDDFAARLMVTLNLNEKELALLAGERAKGIYTEGEALKKREKQAVLFDFD